MLLSSSSPKSKPNVCSFLGCHSLFYCSVTTKKCKHLLIDAGHISIESDLADKQAVQEIHQKRNQQYTDDDYKRLESLMYDKLSLKLEAAQVRKFSIPTTPTHDRFC